MLQISPRHDLTAAEINELEDRLDEFNAEVSGYRDAEQIAFIATRDGEMVGGVAGYTWGGVCGIRQLWVHKDHRRSGLARKLMRLAIDEARARGCACVLLETFDFQAPWLYAKLGFVVVAEIRDKPLGHTEFVMRLQLTGA